MGNIKRWQFKFISNLIPLFLAMRGRYNFSNMARWGDYIEGTYRDNYAKPFDWLAFNVTLAEQSLSTDLAIAFDPSFLPKSGKHTPGLGYFYSGCAGRELRGLELSGLAVIDQQDKTALHLEAIQTINLQQDESLLSLYARSIIERADLQMSGADVFLAYHSRFQIEILYRDAKRHLGLTHCQARSEEKINFHLNASLSTVSLAKVAYHLSDHKYEQKAFSMADIKTRYANELLLDRFISTFGINPQLSKIKSIRDEIRNIGKIAA